MEPVFLIALVVKDKGRKLFSPNPWTKKKEELTRKFANSGGILVLDYSTADGCSLLDGFLIPNNRLEPNVVYMRHPIDQRYLTLSSFSETLLREKEDEFVFIAQELGAKSIMISEDSGGVSEKGISAELGVAGQGGLSASLSSSRSKESHRSRQIKFEAPKNLKPCMPSLARHFPHEPTWRSMVESRLNHGCSEYRCSLTSSEVCKLDSALGLMVLELGLELGGSVTQMSDFHKGVEVTFFSNEEYSGAIQAHMMRRWDETHVLTWLRTIGYDAYSLEFARQHVSGSGLISLLSNRALLEKLVLSPFHQEVLAKEIENLFNPQNGRREVVEESVSRGLGADVETIRRWDHLRGKNQDFARDVHLNSKYDLWYKAVILGNAAVGKTNIMAVYNYGRSVARSGLYHPAFGERDSTIGVECAAGTYEDRRSSIRVKIAVWDTGGQERYRRVTASHFRRSSGLIIVYDVTSRRSFEDALGVWLDLCRKETEKDPSPPLIFLVGNKVDLKDSRVVAYDEALREATKCGIAAVYEVSARTGDHVHDVLDNIFYRMYSNGMHGNIQSRRGIITLHDDGPPRGESKEMMTECCV